MQTRLDQYPCAYPGDDEGLGVLCMETGWDERERFDTFYDVSRAIC